jgi:hypothetical protein
VSGRATNEKGDRGRAGGADARQRCTFLKSPSIKPQ